MSLAPQVRDCVIRIRVTEGERETIRKVARELRISVSDVIRLGASRFCNGDRQNAKFFVARATKNGEWGVGSGEPPEKKSKTQKRGEK